MNRLLTLALLFVVFLHGFSQQKIERPKLVVGVIVDQMRYDYLTRFYNKYGNDGFKRLMHEGYNLQNAHFNYVPTYTAVGHASVYTGTTPDHHGIIGNNWYDKFAQKEIYCVDDDNYKTIGARYEGNKSPKRLLSTTISDELKMTQMRRGKVIGLSLKDRSAILPVGHTADAAYWFLGMKEGKFITSSYYMDDLPEWVKKFNRSNLAKQYLDTTWDTFYNINTYTESIKDDNNYEGVFNTMRKSIFPYDLKRLKHQNGYYDLLKSTPFGNTLVKDFAQAAIIGENLGKTEDITDFLAISFSSTDYIGHQFGVDSKEIEDTYIRLDRDIASFLRFLDREVGKDNYTLFLTADHAAVQVPTYLSDLKVPAGYINWTEFETFLGSFLKDEFGATDIIENRSNYQIFLNKKRLKELKLDVNEVSDKIAAYVVDYMHILKAVSARTMQTTNFDTGILKLVQNGYNQKYSGDVILVLNPSTITYSRTGSTHGSGYMYDTHVPLIFYGKGIKKGNLKRYVPVIDIAPTLSNLLQISFPNSATGNVIYEVLD